jgi:hypothetical protein
LFKASRSLETLCLASRGTSTNAGLTSQSQKPSN